MDLDGNQLTQVPPEIAQLTKLQKLDLRQNPLRELPNALWELQELTELNLNGNQLTRVPPEIAQLTKLQKLYLKKNHLQ